MNNYNPLLHHRHSIRLQGYDYSQEGLYFVTVCTHNMQCLFGNITNGQMILNQFGQIIESACQQIEQQSPYIRFNIYCIMPNHFHAIIEITSSCTGGSRTARTGGGDFDDGVEVVGHDAIDVEADVGGLLFDLLAGGFDDLAKLV